MNRLVVSRYVCTFLAICTLSTLTGCSTVGGMFGGGKKEAGPGQVDDLLTRIERVHIECELSNQRIDDAMRALDALIAHDFTGDPVLAFNAFTSTVKASEKQSAKLAAAVGPMKSAADPFFEQWAGNLSSFASMDMRLRSQTRLENTLARYEAILAAVEPAQSAYQQFNAGLKDHILFLGHDFNAASVNAISAEIDTLSLSAEDLQRRFSESLDAAEAYVHSAALPGQIEMARSGSSSSGSGGTGATASGRSAR